MTSDFKDTQMPSEDSQKPNENSQMPNEDSQMPNEGSQVPNEDSQMPSEDIVHMPSDDTQLLDEESQMPPTRPIETPTTPRRETATAANDDDNDDNDGATPLPSRRQAMNKTPTGNASEIENQVESGAGVVDDGYFSEDVVTSVITEHPTTQSAEYEVGSAHVVVAEDINGEEGPGKEECLESSKESSKLESLTNDQAEEDPEEEIHIVSVSEDDDADDDDGSAGVYLEPTAKKHATPPMPEGSDDAHGEIIGTSLFVNS